MDPIRSATTWFARRRCRCKAKDFISLGDVAAHVAMIDICGRCDRHGLPL